MYHIIMIRFVCDKKNTLIKAITSYSPNISYAECNKLLRKKDIKVNNKRVNSNVDINIGDEIVVYNKIVKLNIEKCYEDENLLIVNKPILIEVSNDKGNSLFDEIKKEYPNIIPCNRLDMNTMGLVIFAKNQDVFKEIKQAFDDKKITKVYIAKVFGTPKKYAVLNDFLFKDSDKKMCYIENKKTNKNEEIRTEYKLINSEGEISTLEVKIHGGKTHQIRCHLSYYKLPIVGDNKYGDINKNKQYKLSRQQLFAVGIIFDIDCGMLKYLNGKRVELKEPISNL